jgi:hypothetical protein
MLKKTMRRTLMNNLKTNKNKILSHNKMIRSKMGRMKKLKKSIMKGRMRKSKRLKRNTHLRKVFKKR